MTLNLDFTLNKYRFGTTANKTLTDYGHLTIKEIKVFRRPIMDTIMNLMNAFTQGEAKKRLKQSPYDALYHLGCYITLENNKIIEADKQQTVKIRPFTKNDPTNEYLTIPVNKQITLLEAMHNTIQLMGESRFFEYDARKSNCQDWMLNLINANGLGNQENNKWIKQDTEFLFKKQNLFEKFMKSSTDLVANAERIFLGGAIKLDTKSTTNEELDQIANKLGFTVTFLMRDETEKISGDGFYVINLDRSGNRGTHWTALIINNKKAYYIDSFGVIPPEEIYNYLLDKYTVYYNSSQYQDNNSSACGLFVLLAMYFMKNNKYSMKKYNIHFVKLFNYQNLKTNDKIVKSKLQSLLN
jgi:hypothetical protein